MDTTELAGLQVRQYEHEHTGFSVVFIHTHTHTGFPHSFHNFLLSLFLGGYSGHHVSRAACWVAPDLSAPCEESAPPVTG